LNVVIGNVNRDFTMSVDASQTAVPLAGTANFALNVKRNGPSFGGSGVTLSLESPPEPSGLALPPGLGAVTFSSTAATPGPTINIGPSTSGTSVNLSVNVGSLGPGQHEFVVRATGMNGDSPGRLVTHLIPLTIGVATGSSGGNQEYVDFSGFAAMRVVAGDANTIKAYAISPVIADMNDPQLRRGQVPRLVPWT
jgi:hypothetical protein